MDEKQRLCLECMECCKVTGIPLGYVSDDRLKEWREFYETRDARIILDLRYSSICYLMVLPIRCKYLDDEKGCTIYPKRPMTCRLFDGLEDPIVGHKCKWKELNNGG